MLFFAHRRRNQVIMQSSKFTHLNLCTTALSSCQSGFLKLLLVSLFPSQPLYQMSSCLTQIIMVCYLRWTHIQKAEYYDNCELHPSRTSLDLWMQFIVSLTVAGI
ncbi:hypothetical protein BDV29DRAFT_176531 [Aspergillus leporis]|uniref:Uncharacterized protein n=1 Tax=Aspergillus leporis TaxID=41062 RepID=A0A5N5WX46_9EURO|nr:hypothetical protein BDV29DRAFT_176531 [Aspergillus leporis]